MLEAGEDPLFVARRMIVFACEDIGNADPRALLVAVAAAHALEHVGLPEARLNLAQAAIYLARAPKSNASYLAIREAAQDVLEHGNVRPPKMARDTSIAAQRKRGHGKGYRLPPRRPARLRARLPPRGAAGTQYYRPSGHGEESDT